MCNLTRLVSGKKTIAFFFLLFAKLTLIQAADFYWVGGTGNWSDFSTHWATSSGGSTFRDTVPLSGDDVYFDANSFSTSGQTVTIDADAFCYDMSWTGATNNPTLTASSTWYELEIYGSLTTISSMTWRADLDEVEFMATSGSHTITSNGLSFGSELSFEGDGTWSLADNLTTTDELSFEDGTFNTANYNMNIASIDSWGLYETVNLGTSDITITPTSSASAYNSTVDFGMWTTLDADYADFIISNPSGYAVAMELGAHYYNDITFNNSSYSVSFPEDANCMDVTFGEDMNISFGEAFSFNDVVFANNDFVTFNSGDAYQVSGSITASADCENYITWTSSSPGTAAAWSVNSDQSVSNIIVMGMSANLIVGNITCDECADVRNNTGGSNDWSFTNKRSARTLYYTGNTGTWGNKDNWSTNSDGTASNGHPSGTGECIPSLIDTVIFNAYSFSSDGQTATMNKSANMCARINFADIDQAATIASSSGHDLLIDGSFTGDTQLTQDIQGDVKFYGTGSSEFILSDDEAFEGSVYFNGSGTYYLEDDLDVDDYIIINDGVLDVYNVANSSIQDIYLGEYWENMVGSSGFNERTSTITFDGSSTGAINYSADNDETFYKVLLNKTYSFSSVYLWDVNLDITQELMVQNGKLDVTEFGGAKTLNCNNLCQITGGEIEIDGDDITVNLAHDLNADGGTFDVSDGDVNITEDIDIDGCKVDVSGGTLDVGGLSSSENGITITSGELEIDGGVTTVGNSTTEDIVVNGGSYDHNGGTVNTIAQFTMSSGDYNQSGGTLNVGTNAGSDNLERIVFSGGSYSLSGGTCDIQSSGNGSSNNVIDIQSGATVGSVSNGGHTFKVSATNNDSRINVDESKKIANLEVAVSSQDAFLDDHIDCDGGVTITSGQLNQNTYNIELTADWTNNASNLGLLNTSESVTFDGSSANQNIGGTYVTTFHDMTINNTYSNGQVDLDVLIFVDGSLTLTSGDIEARDFTLYLTGPDYPGISGGSASAHIDGTLSKIYNSTDLITFPLGDGTNYNPLALTPSGSDTWVVSYETSTPSDYLSLCEETFEKITSDYYWNVSPAGSSTATLRFYWNTNNWSSEDRWDVNLFLLGHYNTTCAEGSGGWELAPGNAANQFTVDTTATGDIAGYIETQQSVTDFSPFAFAKSNVPVILPVEFLDFNAKKENSTVQLEWTTASEINNDYFDVQRYNPNTGSFESIGEINGAGNSTTIEHYNFLDLNPHKGENIYRIKQVDFDLQFDYSNIQTVLFIPNLASAIFPNPGNGTDITITMESPASAVDITVYSASGSLVHKETTEVNGKYMLQFEQNLAPGFYNVFIQSEAQTDQHKLIVQ